MDFSDLTNLMDTGVKVGSGGALALLYMLYDRRLKAKESSEERASKAIESVLSHNDKSLKDSTHMIEELKTALKVCEMQNEEIPIPIFHTDFSNNFLGGNASFNEVFLSPKQIYQSNVVGKPLDIFLDKNFCKEYTNLNASMQKNNKVYGLLTNIKVDSESDFLYMTIKIPVKSVQGYVLYYVGMCFVNY